MKILAVTPVNFDLVESTFEMVIVPPETMETWEWGSVPKEFTVNGVTVPVSGVRAMYLHSLDTLLIEQVSRKS